MEPLNLNTLKNGIRDILLLSAESQRNGVFTMIGGVPEDVVVQIKGNKVTVSVYSQKWDSPGSIAVSPLPIASLNWRRIPTDQLLSSLSTLVEIARGLRQAAHRKCRYCEEIVAPEWMHDEQVCYSCAERVLGVVH